MVNTYLNKLQTELITGNAMEHSYRPAFKSLIEQIDETIQAVNEPTRSAHGSPDFIFLKKGNKNFTFGYAETKDINVNLNDIEKTEQLKRYLGYPRLILTNYIEFRFFRNGEKYQTIEIAKRENTFLKSLPENFLILEKELKAFLEGKPEKITSGIRLAQIMGGKALRIRENVTKYLSTDDGKSEELKRIFKIMKEFLVHDLEVEKFADMYAQTLVYGLFVARYYDNTPENFTRQEARDLVPASNPFLQHFFDHIVGPKFDTRLAYIVDELCEIFSIADIREIIRRHFNLFGEVDDKDPIIHFYEDFLKEYDPELRKEMGAYYTPIPVVNFIIRAVDEVLIKEFKLNGGLANTDKIVKEIITQGKKGKETFHKVQILDPAVGTATFLNEIIKYIYLTFKGQEGIWQSYVEKELLPRLYGFELMMAPYTIAHLKLAMTLKETGINKFSNRLGVYLTNTLEEGIKQRDDLFSFGLSEAISEESKAAGTIKNSRPIMVVIGNPPYSVSSNNKGEYIQDLIKVYKKDLNERKINLDDDYIKFIRFAENLIEKNGEGIVAMITNNSFIDGTSHRQMRKHLLNSFNSIYILNLHGSAKKKEVAKDGKKDENVFNIQQGVSINIFIKNKDYDGQTTKVYFSELFGKKIEKFDFLNKQKLLNIKWQKLTYKEPYYFFVPKDFSSEKDYIVGIPLDKLFGIYSSGIETAKDKLIIKFNKEEASLLKSNFINYSLEELKQIYPEISIDKISQVKKDINNVIFNYSEIQYRPFDNRFTLYSPNSQGVLWRPRSKVMNNLLKDNFALLTCNRQTSSDFRHAFISKIITERCSISLQTGEVGYIFPLYLYTDENQQTVVEANKIRRPNLQIELVKQLLENVKDYTWINEYSEKKESDQTKISPLDILDYTYAVLYSPKYREKYKEFLRIGFPRIPPAKDKKQFFELVKFGNNLRKLHLIEDSELNTFSTKFPIRGENIVEKIKFENDKVWINSTQYFEGVLKSVWDFYVGGYQPVQKWLKDRKGRTLNFEDLTHYQKIIKSLEKTIEVMKKIDEVL